MRLDKSKPFGEVYGPAKYRYEQNGRYFDADGNEVDGDGRPVKEKELKIPTLGKS